MTRAKAGDIVIVDWRGGASPTEPNSLRPAVVVEDETLFAPDYPNILVVPLTSDAGIAMPSLSVTAAMFRPGTYRDLCLNPAGAHDSFARRTGPTGRDPGTNRGRDWCWLANHRPGAPRKPESWFRSH
jgi:hypothetical protein